MKTGKKILFTTLTLAMVSSLTAGVALLANAEETADAYTFNSKYDKVYEDFDRADISDTVTGNTNVALGEKPYLSVTFAAGGASNEDNSIYKQGTGAGEQGAGNIVLYMRAPKGDLSLSDIVLRTRYNDSTDRYSKSFAELADGDGNELPALSTGWQKYVINFANSYEDDEVYNNTTLKVAEGKILGFHVLATEQAAGTLEIASVYYTSDATDGSESARTYLNDFVGGDSVDATAKVSNSATWWAGTTSDGKIVKRAPVLSAGGILTVVKSEATADYSYAYVMADGDTTNLTVATTTDGTTWSEAAAFTSSVAIDAVKGFKFEYTGTNTATINEIFLTNFQTDAVATAVPVIDSSSTQKLDDFNVAQATINGDYDEMSTAVQMQQAGLYYRLSYSNANLVSVADGALILDGETGAQATDYSYINFKTASQTSAIGKYIVFKMKSTDATLSTFRFKLGASDVYSDSEVWASGFKAGNGLATPLLDSSNPYKTADGWYYVVIDLAETGFNAPSDGYNGIDMYYSGSAKLYIDEIFFANELIVDSKTLELDSKLNFEGTTEDYVYKYLYIPQTGEYNILSFDITAKEDDFDISSMRLEFEGTGKTLWASENAEGILKTTDGKMLSELTYTKDVATHVEIDLAACDLMTSFKDVHTHLSTAGGMKAFDLTNVKLIKRETASTAKVYSSDKFVLKDGDNNKAIDFTPTAEGYQWAGKIEGLNSQADNGYKVLAMDITLGEDSDITGVRFEFSEGLRWLSENTAGVLKTVDGKLLSELTYTPNVATTVYIDIAASGLEKISDFDIHTNGTGTGAIKFENITLLKYVDYYAQEMANLPVYETPDVVAPAVKINNATTATAEDEITVDYTVSDNITAVADLTVTVSVKKGNTDVTLTNNKFTAEEGTYTITVTARDAAGNENSDTVQITVAKKATTTTPSTPTDNNTNNNQGSTDNNQGSTDNNQGSTNNNQSSENKENDNNKKTGCGSVSTDSFGGGMMLGALCLGVLGILAVVRKKFRKEN